MNHGMTTIVNIGLGRPVYWTYPYPGALAVYSRAIRRLNDYFEPKWHAELHQGVYGGITETTLVVYGNTYPQRPAWDELSNYVMQDCIAVLQPDQRGIMWGRFAHKWAPFNKQFFAMPKVKE